MSRGYTRHAEGWPRPIWADGRGLHKAPKRRLSEGESDAVPLSVAFDISDARKSAGIGRLGVEPGGSHAACVPTKVGCRWSQLSPDMGMSTVNVADYVARHRGSTNGLPGSGVGQGSTHSYLGAALSGGALVRPPLLN